MLVLSLNELEEYVRLEVFGNTVEGLTRNKQLEVVCCLAFIAVGRPTKYMINHIFRDLLHQLLMRFYFILFQ